MKKEDCIAIVEAIVKEMKKLIGPVAITHANNIKELKINDDGTVAILGKCNRKIILELVKNYEELIGPVALTISREAVKRLKKDLDRILSSSKI